MPKDELTEDELEEYLPGGDPRCQAVTDDGEQCRNKAGEDSIYCWIHEPKSSKGRKMVKFDKEKKRKVVKALEEGDALSPTAAAGEVGVSATAIQDRLDPESPRYDEKFAREIKIAEQAAMARIQRSLIDLITGSWVENKPHFGAVQFALINMSSNRKQWFFPKATKNTMIQQNKQVNEEEDLGPDEVREALEEMGFDLDEPSNGQDDQDFIDIDSD